MLCAMRSLSSELCSALLVPVAIASRRAPARVRLTVGAQLCWVLQQARKDRGQQRSTRAIKDVRRIWLM